MWVSPPVTTLGRGALPRDEALVGLAVVVEPAGARPRFWRSRTCDGMSVAHTITTSCWFEHLVEAGGRVLADRDLAIQAEERAGRARDRARPVSPGARSSPTTAGISERLAAMLQLATEEAADIRARAQSDSEATVAELRASPSGRRRGERSCATRSSREIDELSVIREQLLQRLIELGGEVVGATERFRRRPRTRERALQPEHSGMRSTGPSRGAPCTRTGPGRRRRPIVRGRATCVAMTDQRR